VGQSIANPEQKKARNEMEGGGREAKMSTFLVQSGVKIDSTKMECGQSDLDILGAVPHGKEVAQVYRYSETRKGTAGLVFCGRHFSFQLRLRFTDSFLTWYVR
jgi:hypothetical protein